VVILTRIIITIVIINLKYLMTKSLKEKLLLSLGHLKN
jgi:hypothetical protein